MYASVAQLREYLHQIGAGAGSDAQLTAILERATGLVRDSMRVLLADPTFDYVAFGAASTRLVSGYPTRSLPLPAHQAASVTLVEVESGLTYTTITDAWSEEDGRLYRIGGWGFARYRITAIWGYGVTVPAAIEEVTLEAAVNVWRSRDKGGFTEVVGADGGGAVRVVSGLTKQQQQAIANVADQLRQVFI